MVPSASIEPSDPRPSLPRLLAEHRERTATHVEDVIRTDSAGLLLMTTGPCLAWLALDFPERLPGVPLRPVPVTFGRFRYSSGTTARHCAEDLPPNTRRGPLALPPDIARSRACLVESKIVPAVIEVWRWQRLHC